MDNTIIRKGSGRDLIEVFPSIFLEGPSIVERNLRTTGVLADIRTKYLLNTSSERYRHVTDAPMYRNTAHPSNLLTRIH
jgi:hypothetical protein